MSEDVPSTTNVLIDHLEQIADSSAAKVLFINLDAIGADPSELIRFIKIPIFYVSNSLAEPPPTTELDIHYIRVPNVPLTRMGQVKVAVFLALSRGHVHYGDPIVFLTGRIGSGRLDTLIVTEVGNEYEMFTGANKGFVIPDFIQPEVLEKVIDIASELGAEGREGKQVGTLFVIGDTEHVQFLSRQFILNPFQGYPEEQRNILDPTLEETVKEMSTLDGAFVVRGNGVIESCGTFLKTASQEEFELPRGLGARHHAAAAITAVTDSISVAVSESTGTVTVFQGGGIILDIEKPRSAARKGRL